MNHEHRMCSELSNSVSMIPYFLQSSLNLKLIHLPYAHVAFEVKPHKDSQFLTDRTHITEIILQCIELIINNFLLLMDLTEYPLITCENNKSVKKLTKSVPLYTCRYGKILYGCTVIYFTLCPYLSPASFVNIAGKYGGPRHVPAF